jgi:hypothetical protein
MENNVSKSKDLRFYINNKEIIYKIRSDYVRNDRSKFNR